jgi:uncharacterized protein (TIGR00645 family)
MKQKPSVERVFERALFASRWLLAPFYLGLVIGLAALLVVFAVDVWVEIAHVFAPGAKVEDAILMALSLIDVSLAGNLLLIVIFAGYENFVSRIDTSDHEDRPTWMGTIDFSGLKIKLIASIVAISGIALLKAFMKITEPNVVVDGSIQFKLLWLVIIHMTFVVSGVLLALMDFISSRVIKHSLSFGRVKDGSLNRPTLQ